MNDGPDDPHRNFPGRRANGQFQKGVSGNRKGRPRRARSTKAVMQAMLASRVPTMIDGQVTQLTTIEAMAARVKREALTGPLRSLETAITIAQRYTLDDPVPEEKTFDLWRLDDSEIKELHRLLAKIEGVPEEEIEIDPLNHNDRSREEPDSHLWRDEPSCELPEEREA